MVNVCKHRNKSMFKQTWMCKAYEKLRSKRFGQRHTTIAPFLLIIAQSSLDAMLWDHGRVMN